MRRLREEEIWIEDSGCEVAAVPTLIGVLIMINVF